VAPVANPLYQQNVLNTLPKVGRNAVQASLIEYDINGKQEKPLWQFLVNPAQLDFGRSADYGKVSPHASSTPTQHYNHTNATTLSIPDILLYTHCMGRTVKPLIDGINRLMEATPEKNKFAPPVLMFRWGKFRFGPCVLTNIKWTTRAVLDGDPANVKLSLDFELIAKPKTKAELEAKARIKTSEAAKKRTKEGKPALPLTDRQRKEASDKAKEFLKTNLKAWSPDIQSAIEKNNYKLATNADTGDVTMSVNDQPIGVVLRSLGDANCKADAKSTTVPLAQGAKNPELKPKESTP
jgi:hypothetical protein